MDVMSPSNVDRDEEHDRLYSAAMELCKGEIHVEQGFPSAPGWFARRRLLKAIGLLEGALAIAPDNWNAMFFLGKLHQRIGKPEASLTWFLRARELQPADHDVAREAGIAAIETGRTMLAVTLCRAAVELEPGDPGLAANLAIALLVDGKLEEARTTLRRARDAAPSNLAMNHLEWVIEAVREGRIQRPRSGPEVQAEISRRGGP
jgi:Flp pilus assembly protein TadD